MYLVHMTDPRGLNKVKVVEANTVKEAESKAKRKYPSFEIGRISKKGAELDYYSLIKSKELDG